MGVELLLAAMLATCFISMNISTKILLCLATDHDGGVGCVTKLGGVFENIFFKKLRFDVLL